MNREFWIIGKIEIETLKQLLLLNEDYLNSMAEPKPLIIEAPRQGIAQSPHIGFGDVRNLDIFSIPGIVRLNNNLSKVSGTAVTGLVKWIVRDPVTPANIYAVDDAGDVYVSVNSGASFAALATQPSDGGTGQGLAIWKDYLFCPRATAMDLYGPLSGTPAWRNSWAGLTMTTDSLWHPMLVSRLDGELYGGAGRYVFNISEVAGQTFAWDNAGTYTATAAALTLPAGYRVKCLEELGNNLMIGTWQGTTITDFKVADIFTWDGTSTTYGQPINIVENGINGLLTIGNSLYVLAGVDGRIYRSDGVGAVQVGQIPTSIANVEGGNYLEPFPGAFVNYKGRPTFGISSGAATFTGGMGVYSLLETSKGSILNFEHQLSNFATTGNDGTVAVLKIGALLPIARDQIVVGWLDTTTEGIDLTTTTTRTPTYGGYFESPLYVVGTPLNKRQFGEIEFQLAKELAAGEAIRIKFRINLTDTFTTIGTYDYTTLGAVTSHHSVVNIPETEFIQIRVELGAGTSNLTTPQLKQVILR
jgi:hypothetical protein